MPWELLLFGKLFLLLGFELLLGSSHGDGFEGIRCFHAQVDSKLLLPALAIADGIIRNRCNLSCAHSLGHLGDQAFLRRLARLVNRKDVRVDFWIFDDDASDKSRQIDYVNGWD